MNQRILNKILCYQQNPETVLSCCKKFSIERVYNFRWKNKIYFRDNRIKIINFYDYDLNCKEAWYKYGKINSDIIDQKTGFTLPARVWKDGSQDWYKDGELHRDDIDPETGLTLPAEIDTDVETKYWYKDGKIHRDDIDPKTGLILSSESCNDLMKCWHKDDELHRDDIDPEKGLTLYTYDLDGEEMWYKYDKLHRNEIDPKTGLTLPAIIYAHKQLKNWYNNGELHRDENDPESCNILPAKIRWNRKDEWYKNGVQFYP